MVFDCIPFFNELDILKLRMQIMAPYVDFFVIEEASVTFSGEPKRMIFAENRQLFAEYEGKIRYVPVENSPMEGVTTHERDKFQKNQLIRGLFDCKPEDIIIFSDVDEIPNPNTLTKLMERFESGKVYHLAQRMFYCFLNMEETSGNLLSITGEFPKVERRMWLGTKVFGKRSIPENGIIELREASVMAPGAVRVADGGWHFGYMGSSRETDVSRRIGTKVVAAAHQEYNDEDLLREAGDRLILGQDIFGREARFERVEVDGSYPEYLLAHLEEYSYLIMPPVSGMKKACTGASMVFRRFFRKAARKIRRVLKR